MIDILSIEAFIIVTSLILSIILVSIKQDYRQIKKYFEQANIIALLNINFLIDKFDKFITKNANTELAQYIVFR